MGENVILMVGLHMEMAMLKAIGSWLDGSGWSYVMTSVNVTIEGHAAGLLKGALYTHHVSAGTSSDRICTVYSFSKVICRV